MTEQSTELEVAKPSSGHLQERIKYAQALAAASLLPESYRGKPANVLLAMEYGHALGLDTITAIQQVNVISGKPTASAQLIGGLVRRAGHRLRVTGDDKHAIAEIVRRDDPDFVFRSEWTITRAQAAGLAGKGPWKSYPAAMLKARAITEVARDACPEALAGVAYTAEELGSEEVVPTTPPPADPWTTPTASLGDMGTTEAILVNTDTGEIVEAELVEDTPESEPATKAQLNMIGAMLGKCGLTTREDRLQAVRHALKTEISSSTELTKTEASLVIDTIKPLADAENPAAALAKWYVA